MSLIPWRTKRPEQERNELMPYGGFRSEMDRLFNSFLSDTFDWDDRGAGALGVGFPVDLEESDKGIAVRAEIAGVKPEDLEISIVGNSLVISGEKKEETKRHDGGLYYQERRYGSFRREVPLPATVDPDHVQAEYKDGVLSVNLEKSQEALPKKIKVSSGHSG